MHRSFLIAGIAGAALMSACVGDSRAVDARAADAIAAGGVIDSALPIPVLLQRFRAAIPDTPQVIAGGQSSPERLTRALMTAITDGDTAMVRALVVNRAEFAWLYYPNSKFTARPYELGPELLWLQMRAETEKGITRAFNRYSGTRLRFLGLTCDDSVVVEGPNRLVTGCRVRFAAGDSAAREMRLFGALLNRDGQYKFLSYANDL